MSRYNFFLFAAALMACVYISNANPVKRQAKMGSSPMDSDSLGSNSSGSDSSAPPPSSGSESSSSDSGSGSSGSGSSGSSSFTTGGLFATLARFIAKLPVAGGIASTITDPILINLGKFLG
ncbi:protein rtoA-like isoform X1 [Cotesia glomerata]|uniref:Uncharacterized protein n=1 Tax=Cotesia glomerata TaxID=32391 RepID=A0AAV7I7A1_COTGL|nr:protein rtoA-like isoform X1 [Cotesia glomerata]KAH0547194.1 hypothetical protein KQX54_017496 [Cotesia glomerata]